MSSNSAPISLQKHLRTRLPFYHSTTGEKYCALEMEKNSYDSENDSTSALALALGKDNHALCVNEYQFAWLSCPAEGVLGETAPAPLSCAGKQQKHRGLEELRAGL